jgi:polyribonucleotide nucleotidyltransferase
MDLGGRTLTLETGRMAKQADGAVYVTYEGNAILATAVASDSPREGVDFFPLTVNYQEKQFAAGKIPGGFFRREGRPGERETLCCRLIDRPLRPLFPKGFRNDVQIITNVYSADQVNEPDIPALIGTSAALTISRIPFEGPIGAVRVGRVDGSFVVNPTVEQMNAGTLNMVVAGTADAILMVEAGAREVDEEIIVQALEIAQGEIKKICALQIQLRDLVGAKPKMAFAPPAVDQDLLKSIVDEYLTALKEAMLVKGKHEKVAALKAVQKLAVEEFSSPEKNREKEIAAIFADLEKKEARRLVAEEGRRVDGRRLDEVRPITCEVGFLPRTHSSALFTRGETQALVVTTLGTSQDEQIIDDLSLITRKSFMLHYNFPPFSVNEARMMRGTSRREVGHGALAERSLVPVLPEKDKFPYVLRIVSDILESNGSSSMATVCGATLSLMDAGVPIKAPVAGIAMGLVAQGGGFHILSDIQGVEDHCGDMDFKVAGTAAGITALQMDLKVQGLTHEVMARALAQAKEGRLHILGKMTEALPAPRPDISLYAPRILTMKIKVDKIRDVIGSGGKTIRSIVEQTGCKIEVQDDGTILIASVDEESAKKAMLIIKELTAEAEIGRIYNGRVKRVMDFGAFVEIFAGTEGLVHISQLAEHRVNNIHDEVKEGDEFPVKVIDVDREGKIKLSRKEALRERGGAPQGGPQGGGERQGGGHERPSGPERHGGHDRRR